MAQIRLLDATRTSKLLEDALSWSSSTSSLLVCASNGSILAYAFRSDTPSIKEMRTLSTTMTAAYAAASESLLVYESQSSNTISIVGPVADHILLAVSGTYPVESNSTFITPSHQTTAEEDSTYPDAGTDTENWNSAQAEVRHELETISHDLAAILQEELKDIRWPDDI